MRLRWLFLTSAFALSTTVLGWWGVPLLGAIWGVVGRQTVRPALLAGVSAVTAWALLLGGSGLIGPVGPLATKLGAVVGVPWFLFVAVTLLLAFLLSSSAAYITAMGAGKTKPA